MSPRFSEVGVGMSNKHATDGSSCQRFMGWSNQMRSLRPTT